MDPITKEVLQADQLVEIAKTPEQYATSASVNSPTLNSNYSIPSLLSTLQDEWDAVMLENFQLRQQIEASKRELSTALYKCDAAINVATRATMEAHALRKELNVLTNNLAPEEGNASRAAEQELEDGLPSGMLEEMIEKSKDFATSSRKIKFKTLPCSEMVFDTEVAPIVLNTEHAQMESAYASGNIHNGKLSCIYSATGDCKVVSVSDHITGSVSYSLEEGDTLTFASPVDAGRVTFGTHRGKHGVAELREGKVTTVLGTGENCPIIFTSWLREINENAYILVNANGIVYFANPTERRVMDLKVEPFQTDFAHVHKDGLLILQGNSSSLIVRDLNDVHQKSISFVHDAEAEGNILSAKFASNGYWLVLSTSKVLKIFDLRKAPNTLAMEPIVLTQGSLKDWDIEPGMKMLFTLSEEADGTNWVRQYKFDKPQKKWCLGLEFTTENLLQVQKVDRITHMWDQNSGYLKALCQDKLLTIQLR